MYFKSTKLFVIKAIYSVMYHGIKIVIFIKILKSFHITGGSRAPEVTKMEKTDNKCWCS